jgi:hypothetical protein
VLPLKPGALPVALPFLAAWLASPLVAWWLSRPVVPRRLALGAEDAEQLRLIARRTWHYFERFVTATDHWLPPDNVQEAPEPRIAHRTSPTNIGMGLGLDAGPAHDLGYLDTGELADRTESTLATVEALERHAGHLFNWYDTESLSPLAPRYVSTVDSGNLAGALMTLSAGCVSSPRSAKTGTTCARAPRIRPVCWRKRSRRSRAGRRPRTPLRASGASPRVNWTRCAPALAADGPACARTRRPPGSTARPARHARAGGGGGPAGPEAEAVGEWGSRLDQALSRSPETRPDTMRCADDFAILRPLRRCRRCDGLEVSSTTGPAEVFRDRLPPGGCRRAGRLDASYYDLLASEARLASFIAIAARPGAAGALVPAVARAR